MLLILRDHLIAHSELCLTKGQWLSYESLFTHIVISRHQIEGRLERSIERVETGSGIFVSRCTGFRVRDVAQMNDKVRRSAIQLAHHIGGATCAQLHRINVIPADSRRFSLGDMCVSNDREAEEPIAVDCGIGHWGSASQGRDEQRHHPNQKHCPQPLRQCPVVGFRVSPSITNDSALYP